MPGLSGRLRFVAEWCPDWVASCGDAVNIMTSNILLQCEQCKEKRRLNFHEAQLPRPVLSFPYIDCLIVLTTWNAWIWEGAGWYGGPRGDWAGPGWWWWRWWFRRKWFHLCNSHWSNYIAVLAVGVRHPILFPGQLLRPLFCSSVTYLILLPHMLALFMTSLDHLLVTEWRIWYCCHTCRPC